MTEFLSAQALSFGVGIAGDTIRRRDEAYRAGEKVTPSEVQHGKVARARRDYHHRQARMLVRENQAVHVEDLNIAGTVHNRRLARAIHDAGWAQFVRLIEEKAQRYGRIVHTVSRWLPSSKTCSACGVVQAEQPLSRCQSSPRGGRR